MYRRHIVKSFTGVFPTIAIYIFCAISLARCQVCYSPSGAVLQGYGICSSSTGSSLCCAAEDDCLSNTLCATHNSTFYRGGCTNKSYLTEGCPAFCKTGKLIENTGDQKALNLFQGIPFFLPGVPSTSGSAIRVRLVSNSRIGGTIHLELGHSCGDSTRSF